MVDDKQYYNFTYNYLLPELNMTTRDKIRYLEQTVKNGLYDADIYNLYQQILKISTFKKQLLNETIRQKEKNKLFTIDIYLVSNDDLQFLYNNLTNSETIIVEQLFDDYFTKKLQSKTIYNSILYLNGVERFNVDNQYSNHIVPYQSYDNMIPGLHIYNFSLHPNEYQPSGNVNFLQFKKEMKLELGSNIYDLLPNEIIMNHMFARSYNIIRFISGIVGLAW